jgi:hypothetical protein
MSETQQVRDDFALRVYRGQRDDRRLPETSETLVVWLITQRSRVQSRPRYQGQRPFLEQREGLLLVVCARICAWAPAQAAPSLVPPVSSAISIEASESPMISSARVFATWRSASRSVCMHCFMVNATSACPIRWLSAFQSIFASRPGRIQKGQRRPSHLTGLLADQLAGAGSRRYRRAVACPGAWTLASGGQKPAELAAPVGWCSVVDGDGHGYAI